MWIHGRQCTRDCNDDVFTFFSCFLIIAISPPSLEPPESPEQPAKTSTAIIAVKILIYERFFIFFSPL